ncbi:MAG: 50S ribosomal protein L4 [Myxococcales bacterium]|nr:50S ribosomal protein L4 [Myxococcales bacterium]
MATVNVVSADNKKVGSVDLSASIFEAPVKPDLLHAEVCRQLAKRRAGTHSTKNRSRVSGGNSKPWRQKGTGRARQGTTRAPQWAGGGVVFGPVPRSYEHSLPKKVRRAALRGALSLRNREGAITVVDDLTLPEFKTRRVAEILGALSLADAGVLIVIDQANETLEGSARNLQNVAVLRVAGLNVYDVLRHSKLLFTRAAVAALDERLGADRPRGTAATEEAAT